MILPIVAYGNPVLKRVADEIEEDYPDLKTLIKNMFETMYAARGVGLAAPQIGLGIRLFIVDASPFSEDPEEGDDPKEVALLKNFKKVFINPIIEEESGEEWAFAEGCLSIPEIREDVKRKPEIVISYYDENWELKEEKYAGYAARVIQHEYDHVEGVLFTDKIHPLKRNMLKGRLDDISKGNIDVSYKMKFNVKKKGR